MTSETELMESSSSITCFILQELFARDLEEIIQKIFLFLDPKSLKNSKRTCIEWKEFIDRRIWKSKTGMEELNRKLIFQWKSEKPEKCGYLMFPSRVDFFVCDNQRVVVCFQNRTVVGYDSETLDVLYTFDEFQDKYIQYITVQLDMNENHLLIIIGPVLTILDKTTGKKLYQFFDSTIDMFDRRMIKMIKNTAVVGDAHGNICFIKNENQEEAGRWTVNNFHYANLKGVEGFVTHMGIMGMDGNNDYLAIGSKSGIYLWDVKTMKLVESIIKAKAYMLKMIYPFVFVVGEDFMGFKVYHLETGECIRNYQHSYGIHNVQTNGRFLIISKNEVVLTFDIQELVNEKIHDKDIWMMEQERGYDFCYAVLNKTKIFLIQNYRKLTVLDCWHDRVHDMIDDDNDF